MRVGRHDRGGVDARAHGHVRCRVRVIGGEPRRGVRDRGAGVVVVVAAVAAAAAVVLLGGVVRLARTFFLVVGFWTFPETVGFSAGKESGAPCVAGLA